MKPDQPFSLALGGGGGRGWAHLGVARALDEAGLRPSLIVGTSMGAIVGAALAAGMQPDQIQRFAERGPSIYRMVGKRARFALFDPTPILLRIDAALGSPRIEDLPHRLAITAYDLVSGRPTAITAGPLVEALRRSIAVPLFFPPRPDAEGVWCDAGPWESVPVTVARQLSPNPVIGVWVDVPKPAFMSARPVATLLRGVARLTRGQREDLTARRYFSLLTRRWADPVVAEAPDLLIRPRRGLSNALRFSQVARASAIGYRDAALALQDAGLWSPAPTEAVATRRLPAGAVRGS
ncbi:MAG TPA: patatin-like phospholipase family protein [Candidatus Limnocylindria bacterium]|nr:patatin-like phospholipase family protein [Candidatus Limnocylindria bacterium]